MEGTSSGDNGLHPVSGNRQFGLRVSSDGLDGNSILEEQIDFNSQYLRNMKSLTLLAYAGGDRLWDCLFTNILDHIKIAGQVEEDILSAAYRLSWREVSTYIDGTNVSSNLNCFD